MYRTGKFSVTLDTNTTANELNKDLTKINSWAYQWKMSFNPDPSKHFQDVIFIPRSKKMTHSLLFFKNILLSQFSSHEYFSMILEQLNFLRTF